MDLSKVTRENAASVFADAMPVVMDMITQPDQDRWGAKARGFYAMERLAHGGMAMQLYTYPGVVDACLGHKADMDGERGYELLAILTRCTAVARAMIHRRDIMEYALDNNRLPGDDLLCGIMHSIRDEENPRVLFHITRALGKDMTARAVQRNYVAREKFIM